ncbi:hypothetical protein DFH07DRAFT_910847 [Mycena maculata]|uniref:Uncharacterized protein n=1 Tax=Mycena maculata TaxID=230809 RepID=A0AAD7K8P6_9AGAR|nr:hypothetical protein DFH07DRAFT_910847 [Mycena maculata]
MDVSLEAYLDIVRRVGRRSDIATLCGVCRGFRHAAERALYNTLTVNDVDPRLCTTLAGSPRIASLVVALTVQVRRRYPQDQGSEGDDASVGGGESDPRQLADYWAAVAGALRNTTRLRHLTIDIADPTHSASAWVLEGCRFQLRTFHCDFDWDHELCAFLATQNELYDLFIRDYRDEALKAAPPTEADKIEQEPPSAPILIHDTAETSANTPDLNISLATHDTPAPEPPPCPALPALATLECTFSEAAVAFVPGSPLTRLKTCFSHTDPAGRRAELIALLAALRLSTGPIRALDIADALYTEAASMELLHRISHNQVTAHELRYLGTLVLPVGGRKRLHFYGLLMRLHLLRCIEVDVSAWNPSPSSSPALRALAAELRLYCPDVNTVIFVHEFERTVVNTNPAGVLQIDDEALPELFWREI